MQQLKVDLLIQIPSDLVIISKVELKELKEQSLVGVYWNMKDLEKSVNKKQDWIKANILFKSKFKEILDSEKGGFVYYPKGSGQSWSFHALKMADFLDRNFQQIFS